MEDKVLECPYCHGKRVIPVEMGYYMCETCKQKFSIINGEAVEIDKTKELNYDSIEAEIDGYDLNMQSQAEQILKKMKPNLVKRAKPKKKYKINYLKIIIISLIVLTFAAFAAFGIVVCTKVVPERRYTEAMNELDSDVDSAIYNFSSINFKDSAKQAQLATARKYLEMGDYQNAIIYAKRVGGKVYVECYDGDTKLHEEEVLTKNISYVPEKQGYTNNGWTVVEYEFTNDNYNVLIKLNAKWTENK